MKKSVLVIISFFLISSMTGCGTTPTEIEINSESSVMEAISETTEQAEANTENSETQEEPVITADNTLVVYFSATGTTKKVAERIASVTNADLYEIVPVQPYTSGDLDWHDDNSRTSIEMNDVNFRPEIAGEPVSLESYSTIYIGYPIWWGDAPRIMDTFVESYDFSNKNVIPFCTSGSSGIGNSSDNLKNLANSGNWLSGDRLEADISENDIKAWISSLN
ncbi:MAG: flavodoxin [Ruminococcus sp.]|nr:flavodoxin [Ruminococcus sp.]